MITVGILTLYVGTNKRIEERDFLAKCTQEGQKIGVDVLVFTPQDVDHVRKQVRAHVYKLKEKKWTRSWRPLPSLLFDRCRYQATARFQQWRIFRQKYKHFTYLNHPLANKWRVHQVCQRDPELRSYLPATELYSAAQIRELSNRFATLYIKPINGTGGRGILRLHCTSNGLCNLEGRDQNRRIIRKKIGSKSTLLAQVNRICTAGRNTDRYLVQQAIDIQLRNGRVHDYRIIIQKNNRGQWQMTGGAARIGRSGSITSNLHGGGRAISLEVMLRQTFAVSKVQTIIQDINKLSERIANTLEKHYGRLCELGLDLAIDRHGHPWLLEINPKPAREIFRQTGQLQTYRTAIRRPLEFAKWLHTNR